MRLNKSKKMKIKKILNKNKSKKLMRKIYKKFIKRLIEYIESWKRLKSDYINMSGIININVLFN